MAVAATVLVTPAVAACGSLPVTHGVHRVRGVFANAPADTNVRLIPAPPHPGDGPAEIVTGFLRAAATDVVRARQYLVSEAAWSAGAPLTVYSDSALTPTHVTTNPATAEHVETSTVTVAMTTVATLSAAGALTPTTGRSVTQTFALADVPGIGWRISSAPSGVALSVSDLSSRVQVPLTFFAPTADVTVRTPVLLDPGEDVATTAVDALLAAQPQGLRTFVPAGTALNDVSVSATTVVVDLTARAAAVSRDDLRKLGVQLAGTLLPLETDATAVRIDVGGRPLEGSTRYTASDVDSYDPELSAPAGDPVVVDARGVHTTALPGTGPPDAAGATPVAVSDDGHKVAWVHGRRVLVAPIDALADAVPATGVGTWASVSWGRDGSLWLVRDDVGASDDNVSVLPPGASAATPVALPAALAGPVTGLHIARDGVSATIVSGGVLSTVTVGSDASGQSLHTAVPLARTLSNVSVATASGRDGALLAYGTSGGRRGLWRVATDLGSQLLSGAPVVASVRGPCADGSGPTALALP
ncbi:MAG TPA: LpqB family beta-propeller domain-containing protein, partial [Mycobacteriales bacterium]|nr:LpqB family beta-propeller domain-containing protein [Mycobacteriales bacterium]